jgi:hypothetical protein
VTIIVTDGKKDRPALEKISHLQMFVQSAELRIVGVSPRVSLEVSCQLSNIARGTCNLSLRAVDIAPKHVLGHIQVPINRPVMNGDLLITQHVFDLMHSELRHTASRPASIVLALKEEIAVTTLGDLWLETTTQLTVIDLSIILPLA